jgi:hypothetical protein
MSQLGVSCTDKSRLSVHQNCMYFWYATYPPSSSPKLPHSAPRQPHPPPTKNNNGDTIDSDPQQSRRIDLPARLQRGSQKTLVKRLSSARRNLSRRTRNHLAHLANPEFWWPRSARERKFLYAVLSDSYRYFITHTLPFFLAFKTRADQKYNKNKNETGTKFLIFTEPHQPNIDVTCKRIYELYADYVMKNPFYQIEMPIRCEAFDRNLSAYIKPKH